MPENKGFSEIQKAEPILYSKPKSETYKNLIRSEKHIKDEYSDFMNILHHTDHFLYRKCISQNEID